MTADAFVRMDRMYRHQRHIYDLTRKYYLFGRDDLIRTLDPPPGARILEIGCGTGRNLVALARRYPDAHLFGLDASGEMLKSAATTVAAAGLEARVRLARGLAQDFDSQAGFGEPGGFDVVVLSYVLSMIPDWPGAVRRAIELARPEGLVAVVDFDDQRGWPGWFRKGLQAWLARFHVTPQPEAVGHFAALAEAGLGHLRIDRVLGGYAYRLRFRTAPLTGT
ncbi:MAG: class I SAM-dependent methyltransferase [Magnetospirillum sp. WYHS-4]